MASMQQMMRVIEMDSITISTKEWNTILRTIDTLCALVALSYAGDPNEENQEAFAIHMANIQSALEDS